MKASPHPRRERCLWLRRLLRFSLSVVAGAARLQRVSNRFRHGQENVARGVVEFSTHWDNSLEAHVKVFLLVHLQFLQGHSSFPNKLIMAELVFIAN